MKISLAKIVFRNQRTKIKMKKTNFLMYYIESTGQFYIRFFFKLTFLFWLQIFTFIWASRYLLPVPRLSSTARGLRITTCWPSTPCPPGATPTWTWRYTPCCSTLSVPASRDIYCFVIHPSFSLINLNFYHVQTCHIFGFNI